MRTWAKNILRGLNVLGTKQDELVYDAIREVRHKFQYWEGNDFRPENLNSRDTWKNKCMLSSQMLQRALKRRGIASHITWVDDPAKELNYKRVHDGHCVLMLGNGRIIDMSSGQYGIFPMLDMYAPNIIKRKYNSGKEE